MEIIYLLILLIKIYQNIALKIKRPQRGGLPSGCRLRCGSVMQ